MRKRAQDWNSQPGLWLTVDEDSTVAVRLGRHKAVAFAYPSSDGTTWDTWGSVEVLLRRSGAERHSAQHLHEQAIVPVLVAAGLSPDGEDASAHASERVDWFRSEWTGRTADVAALAAMLFGFLAVETDWRPNGRIDRDSYRPLTFDHPETPMSVFCYLTFGELPTPELVLRSIGTAKLCAGDVLVELRTGPPLAGRSARWAYWRLREGAEDGLCTSILDEADPDDPDFATRDGVVAWVDGTTTAYLACRPVENRAAERTLQGEIVAAAAHPFFAPRGEPARPIPDEILDLREAVVRELQARDRPVCTSGSSAYAFTVYATLDWVQVDVPGVGAFLVAPAGDSRLEVHVLPEVDLGGADAGGVVHRGLKLAGVMDLVTTWSGRGSPAGDAGRR